MTSPTEMRPRMTATIANVLAYFGLSSTDNIIALLLREGIEQVGNYFFVAHLLAFFKHCRIGTFFILFRSKTPIGTKISSYFTFMAVQNIILF